MGLADVVIDLSIELLLAPCEGDGGTGMDLGLDPVMEEIRRVRQEALPALSRGAWERATSAPGWPWVERRTRELLLERSKDLQIALWHGEALLHGQGFPGLVQGLQLMTGLVARFWEGLHPAGEDPEARIQRFQWMDRHWTEALRRLPLAQGVGWDAWEACRGEPGEDGERARQALLKRLEPSHGDGARLAVTRARAELLRFMAVLEARFPPGEAPVPDALRQALEDWEALLDRAGDHAVLGVETAPLVPVIPPSGGATAGDRRQVVARLREGAAWFRIHEPHSPVGPLVARAARWADLPLEAWLAEVLKEPGVLAQVRELLDLPGEPG